MYGDEVDDDYYDDYYGQEDDYGIGSNRNIQKALSKKGRSKVTNKQISNVMTAQVKRKC
jgi:hypothetical protein